MSASRKGKALTAEQRQRISDGLRRNGTHKGRVFTDEWKAKLSASRRRRTAEGRDPERASSGRFTKKGD